MSARLKANLYLIAAVVFTAVLIFSPFAAGLLNKAVVNCPDVINGTVDFKDTKITVNNPLYLSGEWVRFDGHIITEAPISNEGKGELIPPSLAADNFDFSTPSGSHSSYRITVKNLDFKNAVVYIPHFAGSYEVFVDGVSVSNGESRNAFSFDGDKSYDIVIEIDCLMMPGIYMTPVIADYGYIEIYTDIATTFRCAIVGIVLFCGVFIFVYSVKKNSLFTSKWLPLLCILIALRMMISTEGFSAFGFLFPSVNYEYITLIICISTFIIKLVALLFYTETLDLKIGNNTFAVLCAAFLGCAVITAFFPYTVFSPYFYIILQAATLPLDIILLSRLTDCMVRKVPYATTYTLGYIAVIVGIMVDCFYTNGLIPFIASSYMPIAFGLFVITFTAIFAKKLTGIYTTALNAAELKNELTAATTAAMISQIQPHFLYNALNTIKYLIKRDPKTAEKAVIAFSKYLRGNMDSISQKHPIPFETELEHIKNYCAIELLRFGDKLNIVYNTDFTDFSVPPLSIQPLVENAIKHGVTKKPEGGTVTVSSFEEAEFYCVVIEDDGIGFDPENPDFAPDDSHSHIGLSNVSNRLKIMVNAQLNIESEQGKGTRVTIKIPKEARK